MNPDAIRQLQNSLNARGLKVPVSGILDQATMSAMNQAVSSSVASNPRLTQISGINSPDAIVNAYMTNDWTGVSDISGKPFSQKDQEQAFAQSERALAPAFKAQTAYDEAVVADTLQSDQNAFGDFLSSEAEGFKDNKIAQDQNAADQGILFSGSRYQKLNDLKQTYEDRQRQQREAVSGDIGTTARNFQYKYGNEGASRLSDYYNLGQGNVYNPQSAQNGVTSTSRLSSVYNPSDYKFQGTAVTANKAAAQQRAGGLLSNKANKLSMTGYKTQY